MFAAPLIGEGSFNLSVAAGRWIVLSFLGSPADPRGEIELAEIFKSAHVFDEDRIVFYGIFSAPPADPAPYLARTSAAVSFLADYDGAISRAFGAAAMPRTIVLDPSCGPLPASASITPTATRRPCAMCSRACRQWTIRLAFR